MEKVVNYVTTMNYGLERLNSFPPSLRLIREIHEQLLTGVRGADKTPGDFRATQNCIRGANAPLPQATFVPPPVHETPSRVSAMTRMFHPK